MLANENLHYPGILKKMKIRRIKTDKNMMTMQKVCISNFTIQQKKIKNPGILPKLKYIFVCKKIQSLLI